MKASNLISGRDFKYLPVKTKQLHNNHIPKKIDANFTFDQLLEIDIDDEGHKKACKVCRFDRHQDCCCDVEI